MAPGMTFRRDCPECNHSFVTPDRKARYCPKCVPKVKEREEKARKARQKKPSPLPPPPTPRATEEKPAVLTDELKARILEAYETHEAQPGIPQRLVNREIARELGVPRILVAAVLQKQMPPRTLSPEEKEEVVKRYQEYLERMERPERGRRKTIAGEMGIPFRSVAAAVREWKRTQRPMNDLNRDERFQLEKAYFRLLREGKSLKDIFRKIAEESRFDRWHIMRYLDTLHDGEKRLKKVPATTTEQKEAILKGYSDYLAAPSPPESFLHNLLAEKSGATHTQVHRVLLDYRLNLLRQLKSFQHPEALNMTSEGG